jgi:methanogenic corrinoid protein MtbC1
MDHPAIETLARALAALDADACVRIVDEVGKAMGPDRMVADVYLPALARLADIWARGLLDDLAFAQAAVISEQLWATMPVSTPARPGAPGGRPSGPPPIVVIGTVTPDVHDIGKNQVVRLFGRSGVRTHDLGAGARASAFAEKAKETGADVVMVSVSTRESVEALSYVRDALDLAGLPGVPLLAGGEAATLGEPSPSADAVAADAYEALDYVFEVKASGTPGRAPKGGGKRG